MFATLLGPLPEPPDIPATDAAARIDAVLGLQADHGLEPLTPPALRTPSDDPVAAWRAASERADRLVKAVIVGPFTAGSDGATERRQVDALVADGCRWIEVHEPAAVGIGTDPAARAAFAAAHRVLTADLGDVHASLAITGGNADAAGIETILAGAYASLALDLIDGADNWRLVTRTPTGRGIIAGALSTRAGSDDGPELLLWAAGYAASTGGRGGARVGLASAGSLAHLPWDVAATKVRRLGEAARLVDAPPAERAAAVDPRAVDRRSAAAGRVVPRSERPQRARRPGR